MDAIELKSKSCSYLQIGTYLRQAIMAGEFPPGCRMPTVGELAKRFCTSTFTIQSALKPLERDGLIEQKRRIGIFVRNARSRLQTMGIYYGRDIWAMEELEFYRRLHNSLNQRLKSSGLSSRLFIDDRDQAEADTPYPPLLRAIEQGEIQAVAAPIVDWTRVQWFKDLAIPHTFYGSAGFPGRVGDDLDSFLDVTCRALQPTDRTRVALISNQSSFQDHFADAIAPYGFETRPEWQFGPTENDITGRLQSFGYDSFIRLWSLPEKPEILIVSPDSICRGVVTAILACGVKVPEELVVAYQYNRDVDFPCPFPMLRISADRQALVEAMMTQISDALQGRSQGKITIPFTLEKT